MKLTNYQRADRNIQYRVLLACIKESLFPEDAHVNMNPSSIDIQFHQHVLHVKCQTQSAFFQIHLEGPITYQAGDIKKEMDCLETLIFYLEKYFNIPFHDQLTEELKHSRLGMTLTYEQYEQRKIAMQHSLKMTRLPDKINFVSWLSHMQGNNEWTSLSYTEGMVWEGHPSHPLTKTKLPLNESEIRAYAPEFMKTVLLRLVLVHQDELAITAMDGNDRFIGEHVVPEFNGRLKQFLEPLGCQLNEYRIMLVHPWQYEHVITTQFAHRIQMLRIIPTPYTVPAKATLSFRTMALDQKPYHIKLPVNVQATSAVRTVSTVTTVDGPKLSYQLQRLLNIYPTLQVALEPYGAYVKEEPDIARQFGMIVRQSPATTNQNKLQFVTAALTQENPVDEQITVDSLIEFLYDTVNEETIERFIKDYTDALIPPLIAYIQTYGIALEAHQQNTILQIDQQTRGFSFIVRDLGGSRIDLPTLQKEVPDLTITNQSLIADNIEAVVAKFQHAVIQNQLGTLIDHFSHIHHIEEHRLYAIVADCLDKSIKNHLAHAEVLNDILFGQSVTVKALLNMRMHQKVKSYMQIELANPIQKEV
ncbi:siderophore synthetase [Staphylococcus hyicus]|uniref:IucA/IucC family protein n=2 Tax=Staphylococcus hyicus TaxID=1284 RepID=A0ACD5FPP2_STAHY|nr:IucA/IucC family protein [Staphylococcus hyicus]MCE5154035.1 siderophore synthetase [Staphylococcus hyicus]MDP4449077.1 IucA/IucC family protein [Staphylococcus hyicus]MDP4463091.1 IucA/IucC family protein [Staphylococcus hyicus]MDY3698613.1 IucA/IucC family protein [Staphylococcus hyicus]NJH80900.1 siderophore synthetase [Staphylococcus hyicus]